MTNRCYIHSIEKVKISWTVQVRTISYIVIDWCAYTFRFSFFFPSSLLLSMFGSIDWSLVGSFLLFLITTTIHPSFSLSCCVSQLDSCDERVMRTGIDDNKRDQHDDDETIKDMKYDFFSFLFFLLRFSYFLFLFYLLFCE
jgi:hypothetical protein